MSLGLPIFGIDCDWGGYMSAIIELGDHNDATAQVGDSLVIRLPETAGTGFSWTAEVSGPGLVVADDSRETTGTQQPGSAGQRVFRLDATAAGEVDVSLTLARPWDPASTSEVRRVHVVVNPA